MDFFVTGFYCVSRGLIVQIRGNLQPLLSLPSIPRVVPAVLSHILCFYCCSTFHSDNLTHLRRIILREKLIARDFKSLLFKLQLNCFLSVQLLLSALGRVNYSFCVLTLVNNSILFYLHYICLCTLEICFTRSASFFPKLFSRFEKHSHILIWFLAHDR